MTDIDAVDAFRRQLAAVAPDTLALALGALSEDPAQTGTAERVVVGVALTGSAAVATEDDELTLTVSLAEGQDATGAVYFCVDDEIVGTAQVVAGAASVILTFDEGVHAVTAHYIGDERHHPVESPAIVITVTTAP